MFINCSVKSASEYIWDCLADGLGRKRWQPSGGVWPDALIIPNMLGVCERNGWVARGHVPANRYNVIEFNQHVDRLVVHVRDPRQVLVSWHHYMLDPPDGLPTMHAHQRIPGDFASWAVADQLDFHIEHIYLQSVAWIDAWVAQDEAPSFRPTIKFSTYAAFVRNPNAWLRDVVAFFGEDPDELRCPAPRLAREHRNFRNGAVDEWRHVLSPAQQDKVNALLPAHLCARFGWPKEALDRSA